MRSVGRDPATYRSIKRMRQHRGFFHRASRIYK
jgi:hypothetical protein